MLTPNFSCIGALPGENNLTTGCHRDGKSANFMPSVCSPTEEAGKNVQTGFLGDLQLLQAFFRDLRPANIVIVGGKE
jgi:hypothetical protein